METLQIKKKGKKRFSTSRMNVFFNHLPTTLFFFVTRMLKEWNRLFPESWRNIWRKNVLVSSLTVSPNVVKYLNVPVFVSSLQPASGDVLLPLLLLCYPFKRAEAKVSRTPSCLICQPSSTKTRTEQKVWTNCVGKTLFSCSNTLGSIYV